MSSLNIEMLNRYGGGAMFSKLMKKPLDFLSQIGLEGQLGALGVGKKMKLYRGSEDILKQLNSP